ncbi:Malonyl CoA-acyl carrier protein transacylase [Chromobacterium violaceum]|uniref:[acyl-carrier-protein] S-malonyltransferase n=1 Tax=Chromobacterium violaceum TaxID=536 RepID=A0A447THX2_CHRVL|nr:Malonyl CoA-acyl carrier protein transacylase [Chromobacterium violaceum]
MAAGALPFAEAVKLVRLRAEAMQAAVPAGAGAMAAILNLPDEDIRAACAEAAQGEVVEAVNFNSPGQVVIAGNKGAVERAMDLCKEKGAKRALPLPVSVPSHCSLMRPAAERLAEALRDVHLSAPAVPVLHNADVASYNDAAQIRDALTRQLFMPVRWTETIQKLAAEGVTLMAECGPGKVLTGLAKRIDGNVKCLALTDRAALEAAREELV